MDTWRERLRIVVASWALPPEEQTSIVDELEQHLEMDLAHLAPRLGQAAAQERLLAQVNDPRLRDLAFLSRRRPAATVQESRERSAGLSPLIRDVRYGWRALRAAAGTTLMATIALALGIGLTTVMFTILYGLVLRGLPYDNADRIAMVMEANPSQGQRELALSPREFIAYRDAQRSFDAFGAWTVATVNFADGDSPERIQGARVTASVLDIPGVRPALGRALRPADELPSSASVVVLSHTLWRTRYAADTSVLGREARINGLTTTIVGVMPEGFGFPREAALWLPLHLEVSSTSTPAASQVSGVGRLRPGVSLNEARANLGTIAADLARETPATNKGVIPIVQPFIRATIPGRVYTLLYVMFGAVGLVFLVACTNVANLLLARAANRVKEVAVRLALGASRMAIARQFLVEALVLALMASAFGALIAKTGISIFERATAGQLPFWADFTMHTQVFGFIALATLLASIVSGSLPAFTAARSDLTDVMKEQSMGSSKRSGRMTRGLVVFELALSSALLVMAALATKSVMNLRSIEPNFRTANVLTARVSLATRDTAAQQAFFERLHAALGSVPGASGALSTGLPGPGWAGSAIAVEGRTYPSRLRPAVWTLAVTPDFFRLFDVRVLRGRTINAEDGRGASRVAVVNRRFVERNFPSEEPLGRRINLTPSDSTQDWATIIGVVPNLYASDPGSVMRGQPFPAEVFTAFEQESHGSATIVIQGADPGRLAGSLRAAVASLDRDLPVYDVASMSEALAKSRAEVGVFGSLFMVFGGVALALAAMGLYAVLAFSVSQRERELGIRMALGAAAADVVRLVLKDGLSQLVVGLSIGLVIGFGLSRGAQAILFDARATDPVILGGVAGTLVVAGMVACLVPALKATRADPVRSLRSE